MRRTLLSSALLATAIGCADPTAIVIEVESDVAVPDDVDALRFEAVAASGRRVDRTVPIASGGPHSFAILPASAADLDVAITVSALRGGQVRLRRSVAATFVRGAVERVQVVLSRACLDLACPQGECAGGRCGEGDAGVDGSVVNVDGGRDGGVDGGEDGGVDGGVDGGTRTVRCARESCAGRVVISELATSGAAGGTDEYVEVYNRSEFAVDLQGLELRYRSQSGNESIRARVGAPLVVPSRGFALFAGLQYPGTVDVADRWAQGIANNGTVLLAIGTEVLDLVGCADASSVEGTAIPGSSPCAIACERKASASSDAASMERGGRDELAGNGHDTNDNSADFVQRSARDPQTLGSPHEPR